MMFISHYIQYKHYILYQFYSCLTLFLYHSLHHRIVLVGVAANFLVLPALEEPSLFSRDPQGVPVDPGGLLQ